MNKTYEQNSLAIFENFKIRRHYIDINETWYFSIIDIIKVLTESNVPKRYWSDLKIKLKNEGSQVYDKIVQLKLVAPDGKKYPTDCFSTADLFRVIQSIPSPKAEPFKLWLAKVGHERIVEMADPEKALNRSRLYWQKSGRSEKWIQQRMMGQETRNKLTDYWANHEVKEGKEFAILTNIIHQEWSGLSVKSHKNIKGLKNQNLRDHMSEAELLFTALAEYSTRQFAEVEKATGLDENKIAGYKGGKISKNARIDLEQKTGRKIVSGDNFLEDKSKKKIK